jgi:hypothetical protein
MIQFHVRKLGNKSDLEAEANFSYLLITNRIKDLKLLKTNLFFVKQSKFRNCMIAFIRDKSKA